MLKYIFTVMVVTFASAGFSSSEEERPAAPAVVEQAPEAGEAEPRVGSTEQILSDGASVIKGAAHDVSKGVKKAKRKFGKWLKKHA